eukprot:970007-Alexandrium_andersonii.AAC.1
MKGDGVKSRICAREYAWRDKGRKGLFCATPQLVTLSCLEIWALSRGYPMAKGDISVAFLHVKQNGR